MDLVLAACLAGLVMQLPWAATPLALVVLQAWLLVMQTVDAVLRQAWTAIDALDRPHALLLLHVELRAAQSWTLRVLSGVRLILWQVRRPIERHLGCLDLGLPAIVSRAARRAVLASTHLHLQVLVEWHVVCRFDCDAGPRVVPWIHLEASLAHRMQRLVDFFETARAIIRDRARAPLFLAQRRVLRHPVVQVRLAFVFRVD